MIKGLLTWLLAGAYLLAGCSMDNMARPCTDKDGTFHFMGASPPLKPGSLERIWDLNEDAVVFEAVPDFTFTDLGDLGPTYIIIVKYGSVALGTAMGVFSTYLKNQSFCGEGECEATPFELGENIGEMILWRMKSYGFQWYARDYMFQRGGEIYHVSIQSIERENRAEYQSLIESFSPESPPSETECRTDINIPTYNPSSLFN